MWCTGCVPLLLLLGSLLCLAGCGGETAPPSAAPSGADFQWGPPRASDPPGLAATQDADGTVVDAGLGQLLITVRDEATDDQLDSLLDKILSLDGDIVGAVEGANLVQVQFGENANLAALEREFASLPSVEAVSLNELAEVIDPPAQALPKTKATSPSLPTAFAGDYWMAQIGLRGAWARLPPNNAWPSLGIVDGGPKDLSTMIAASRVELVDSQGAPLRDVVTNDDHLSRVAAQAAADGSTSTWGIAFGSALFAVDVERPAISMSGTAGSLEKVYFARIVWAADRLMQKGCRVINISLGPPNVSPATPDTEYYHAAQRFRRNLVGTVGQAVRKNTLICIASGNEAKKREDRLLPGSEPGAGFETNVLMVAANGPGDPRGAASGFPAVQSYANEGALVPITAPGEDVSPGPNVTPDGGTSYSSPMVAGAALAVMQAAPWVSASQVRNILIETGSRNVISGSGLRLLDLDAAITRALNTAP